MTNNNKNDSNNVLRKLIEEKVEVNLKQPITDLLHSEQSTNLQQLIEKLQLEAIEDEVCNEFEKAHQEHKPITLWPDFNFDCYDYSTIIDNLNGNSTIAKLKVLDELLNIPIIDTKQQLWHDLSLCLQRCFVSANNEIFLKILRIHHKIITFCNTTIEGFMNLLHGCLILLHSRYFSDVSKNRVPQVVKMIFGLVRDLIRQLLHSNHRQINEIITGFVKILEHQSILNLIEIFDRKANWLKYFCYGAYIRNSLFNSLKKSDVIKNLILEFLKYLNHQTNIVTSGFILMYFLSYKSNFDYFPIQLNEIKIVTIPQIVEAIIHRINRDKNEYIIEILTTLSRNSIKFTSKCLNLLINFHEINRENIKTTIINNKHVYTIIKNIAKSPKFGILFGNCTKFHKSKSRIILKNSQNYPQKIVDSATLLFENADYDDLISILDCCQSIYSCHSVAFYYINSENFVLSLRNLYRTTTKFEDKIEILNFLNFFHSRYPLTIKIIGCDEQILTDIFTFNRPLKIIITTIANNRIGYEFLKSVAPNIIKSYLENIWDIDEKFDGFLTLNEQIFGVVKDFLIFLYIVKFNYKAMMAFLSDDTESTIVENSDNTVSLDELIEKCLLSNCNSCMEEYLGLLVVKVLIINLDLMVYLEANYQIQEKLIVMQQNSIKYNDQIIIDCYSSLRHNILLSLNSIGYNNLVEIDNNILEQTELIEFSGRVEELEETNELLEFLKRNHKVDGDFGWILQARRHFKASLNSINFLTVMRLLEQIPKTYVYRKIELNWPPNDSVYYQLYPEDFIGISTIVKYGREIKLLDFEDHVEQLAILIKQSRAFLNHQPEAFSNFDWFVGVIYLVCCGVVENCKSILVNFVDSHVIALIWKTFGKEFDHQIQEKFYHQLPMILEDNCQSFKALQILEIAPEILVQSWLGQCFFNMMSFSEICKFLEFTILYPSECLLYYVVAIFKHLDTKICVNTHMKSIETMLKMCDMHDFHLKDYIEFIEKLMRQYRNIHKLC